MITIRKLAEMFGLSRTTLLYYDRIGLLRPVKRSRAGYRLYDNRSVAQLRLISTYKSTGLPLKEIRELMETPDAPEKEVFCNRILALDQEIAKLRIQQRALVNILRKSGHESPASAIDKNAWVEILRQSGMNETDMQRWHTEFEHNAPQAHHSFLLWLGIPENEVLDIRKRSKNIKQKSSS
jgi:DNA-binding transcriptional MerR regulator